MARYTARQYNVQVMLVMAVYVVVMLLVWPEVRGASSPSLKGLLALIPVLPLVLFIGLTVKRVMRSDELEQRLHLIALAIAAGVVSMLSVIGGFLAMARVVEIDGDILFWVFPVLCIAYGLAHVWMRRRYGGSWTECG